MRCQSSSDSATVDRGTHTAVQHDRLVHGDPPLAKEVTALLQANPDESLHWLDDDHRLMRHVREGYAAFVDALCTHADDITAVVRAFDSFRVLL